MLDVENTYESVGGRVGNSGSGVNDAVVGACTIVRKVEQLFGEHRSNDQVAALGQ